MSARYFPAAETIIRTAGLVSLTSVNSAFGQVWSIQFARFNAVFIDVNGKRTGPLGLYAQ
jgi:hypothetical protein